MAFDAFLKIDGIPGSSADAKHKDWIEIQSFSWGLENTGSFSGGGGGGAGRAIARDVQFVTNASAASPRLFLACASGRHYQEAFLSVLRAGADQREFYKWRLTEILISSYRAAADTGADEVPADQFSVDFRAIEFAFIPDRPDGGADVPVEAGWDFAKNQQS